MDLSTITMERDVAKQKFDEYRASVKLRHDAEDAQIMRGYRALSRGQTLISLRETMRLGGIKHYDVSIWDNGRYVAQNRNYPVLAISRADQRECWVTRYRSHMAMQPVPHNRSGFYRTNVDYAWFDGDRPFGSESNAPDMRAMVPPVPPALRPKAKLSNFHVLWEAQWEQVAPPRPPGDPALLRHIGGDLYAVLAVWDLTPLEQAVLAGRTS